MATPPSPTQAPGPSAAPPVAPWPNPSAVMGKPATRVDGPAKVTGAAQYTYDVQPEGWLYGMVLRSKWPAAKVTRIDLSKAQAMPGVKAVYHRGNIGKIYRVAPASGFSGIAIRQLEKTRIKV